MTELKSQKLEPLSIDPRALYQRIEIQAREIRRFSWQFQDSGPVPDVALQRMAEKVNAIKSAAKKTLDQWEEAVAKGVDKAFEMRMAAEHTSMTGREKHLCYAPVPRPVTVHSLAVLVAEIAESATYVEFMHQRMMGIIDPNRGKPTVTEQGLWDKQAECLKKERAEVLDEFLKKVRKAYEEWKAEHSVGLNF